MTIEQTPPPQLDLENPDLYRGIIVRRILAYLIDLTIIAVIVTIAWFVFPILIAVTFGALTPFLVAFTALVSTLYHTLLIGGPASATFGMRFFGLRVWTSDGLRPGYPQALVNTVVFYLSVATTSWLILIIGLLNSRNRCLHDLLAGTVVVRQ